MNNKDWQMNKQLEEKYKNSIGSVWKLIMSNITKIDNLDDMVKFLQTLPNFKSFQNMADIMAKRMVTMANTMEARTWREAAKESSRGRDIFEALRDMLNHTHVGMAVKEQILENASLIRTLPLDVARDVNKFIAPKVARGIRSSEIAKELHGKIEQYTKARANLIARTESSKVMTAITEARSKDIGCDWYIWRTANDGLRVRPSHRVMKDVVVNYNDPPAPEELIGEKSAGHYNAGNIYNCRCFPRPLIVLDTISWPAKVYHHGRIVMMSRLEFEQLSGMKKGTIIPQKMPLPKAKAIPITPKPEYKPFNEKDFVIVNRNDIEDYVNKFWGNLSREEVEATTRYIATGNSFSLNRYLYEGEYARDKANLGIDNTTEIEKLKEQKELLEKQSDEIRIKAREIRQKIDNAESELEEDMLEVEMQKLRRERTRNSNEIGDILDKLSKLHKSGPTQEMKEIDAFSAVVAKAKIPQNMQVIRNVGRNFLDYIFDKINLSHDQRPSRHDFKDVVNILKQKARGAKYTNESFTSTSYNANQNVFKSHPIQFQFYVEAGAEGLITRNWSESEIVFNKGSRIQLIDFDMQEVYGDEKLIIKARILK